MHSHEAGQVPGLRPYLVAHVRTGWHLIGTVFRDDEGEEIDTADLLPATTRIEPMVPGLREPSGTAEASLARYLHIILPLDSDPDDYIDSLRELECLDEVRKPPEISLPKGIA